MIIDESAYLEHHGVKGQKWGVRRAKAASAARTAGRASVVTGKVAVKGTKAVGRGAKKTGQFLGRHKKAVARTAAGAAFAATLLGRASSNERARMSSADFAKKAAAGKARYAEQGLGVLRVRSIDAVSRVVEKGVLV